jgi:flagellin
VDHLGTTIENISAANSQIRDVDVASESANFAKSQVLQQAAVAMLAQANAQPNLALRLLG